MSRKLINKIVTSFIIFIFVASSALTVVLYFTGDSTGVQAQPANNDNLYTEEIDNGEIIDLLEEVLTGTKQEIPTGTNTVVTE